mmetsp:Transcript_18167/g.50432  ORF Transcript_18167/g.50432 Transcript_18167/m.50432 type:complete len:100 (-) Transcript_18167:453-752(-)
MAQPSHSMDGPQQIKGRHGAPGLRHTWQVRQQRPIFPEHPGQSHAVSVAVHCMMQINVWYGTMQCGEKDRRSEECNRCEPRESYAKAISEESNQDQSAA